MLNFPFKALNIYNIGALFYRDPFTLPNLTLLKLPLKVEVFRRGLYRLYSAPKTVEGELNVKKSQPTSNKGGVKMIWTLLIVCITPSSKGCRNIRRNPLSKP